MKINLPGCLSIISIVFFLTGCGTKVRNMISVEINYGSKIEKHEVVVSKYGGLTALEAVQYAAKVETHPVGKYVFVSAINDVKGERGVNAWYYEVNGKPAKTLAIRNMLKPGDKITWSYRKDVCSGQVD